MAPEEHEPHTPDNSSLNSEDKLKFINDVINETNELLKNSFSAQEFISGVYELTCMENEFNVKLTDGSIKVVSGLRGTEEVEWNKIKKVSIVTNDKGPFTADVFMVILSDAGGCMVPQGNNNYQELYDKITGFENVNFENIIKAMSSSSNAEFVIWENKNQTVTKMLCYALFNCDPSSKPPFPLSLGFSDGTKLNIENCANIPEALTKMEEYCKMEKVERSPQFTLLYPIYMEHMDTDLESAMHNIAWIIKEKADEFKWNCDRPGGLSNKKPEDFIK